MDADRGNRAVKPFGNSVLADGVQTGVSSIPRSGLIQPQGCLLAFDAETLLLQRQSANASRFFAPQDIPFGVSLESCVGANAAEAILRATRESLTTGRPCLLFGFRMGESQITCDVAVHIAGQDLVVECTPQSPLGLNGELICLLRSAIDSLREKTDFQVLCNEAVVQLRSMTGYDHVMLYRFAPNGMAEVVADDCRANLSSLAGQFMAPEDLPLAVRGVYRRSLVRVIEDVGASPEPVLSMPDLPAFDLSLVMLRAVSPTGRAYLQDCGIHASLLLSLVVDGALWGMIVCRHYSPKNIPMDERAVAKMLGEYVALQISAVVRLNRLQMTHRAHTLIQEFIQLGTTFSGDIPSYIRAHIGELASLVECDGIAVFMEGGYGSHGLPFSEEALEALVRWSQSCAGDMTQIWSTVSLAEDAPALVSRFPGIAGLMVIPLTVQPGDYLYLFRKEKMWIVNRAPRPGEGVDVRCGESGFCQEQMHNCSGAWTIENEEAAEELRSALIEATGIYRQIQLEQRAEAEAQQRLLNDELTHRVKNILSVVQSVVSRSISDESDPQDGLRRLRDRIGALATAHDQIIGANAGGRLSALLQAELAPYATPTVTITISGPDLWMSGKALSIMTLLFHELATNAAKYGALSADKGHLDIHWYFDEDSQTWKLTWMETEGPAVQEPIRSGFGTILLDRALKHELGGAARREFRPEGIVIYLTLPARHVREVKDSGRTHWHIAQSPETERPTGTHGNAETLQEMEVLIVEDQVLIAMEAEDTLLEHGVGSVCSAASVCEALELIESRAPDAAILDINLGDENALEVAVLLKKQGIPFIFTTGYANHTMIPKEFHDIPVVQKPYSSTAMIRALKAVLP
ncbi:HWE histidine kinase domain-containing protein [Acetobacter conturbans]|uniref:histidine kinase n=1 Tax=Acetobacter conturbans TaxID=1737472 RepID=A0ABX0JWW8_9PROT|nr:HWE histidine kinase domain-containing protein [Acetobacter conturbans]NHN87495.1 GAF domain-containing protein [Acetobacter conturbans]